MSIEYEILNWICIPEKIKSKLHPMNIAYIVADKGEIVEFNNFFKNNSWFNEFNYHYLSSFIKNWPSYDLYVPITGSLGKRYWISIKGFVIDKIKLRIMNYIIDKKRNVGYFLYNKYITVKQLVVSTFLPELSHYRTIHIDGDKNNNCLFNFKFIGLKRDPADKFVHIPIYG